MRYCENGLDFERLNRDVTLAHADADQVARMLSDYARTQFDHARRTKSAAIRGACECAGNQANELADKITAELWVWVNR